MASSMPGASAPQGLARKRLQAAQRLAGVPALLECSSCAGALAHLMARQHGPAPCSSPLPARALQPHALSHLQSSLAHTHTRIRTHTHTQTHTHTHTHTRVGGTQELPRLADARSEQALAYAADLLGVPVAELRVVLTTRTRQTTDGGWAGLGHGAAD